MIQRIRQLLIIRYIQIEQCGKNIGSYCCVSLVAETCNDGIQNQGEDGVDCGGPCANCGK